MDVCGKLRSVLKTRKVGHAGTLDPMATGVLPVFVGQATRAVSFAETGDKEYVAGLRLGCVTNTQDTSGDVLEQHPVHVTRQELEALLPRFTGEVMQVPPMYSAIKINGQKLYQLARQGKEVERPARPVTIHELEVLGQDESGNWLLRILCSKGTYVRTLCHDMGQALGCGGCMSSLRRTMAAGFTLADSHTIEEVQELGDAGPRRLPGPAIPRLRHPPGGGRAAVPLRQSPDGGGAGRAVPRIRAGRQLSVPEPRGGRRFDLPEKLFRSVNTLERTVIALGFFDGVHRGHGALLQRTAERARELGAEPVVFTFDRPPKEVVTGQPVYLINSAEDRQDLIRRLYGIDRIILAPFDREMMTMSWEDFVTELLVKRCGAVHLVAGHDHRFGHKNAGNAQLLREKCAQLGLGCDIIPEVVHDGITVSSTYIRKLVAAGDVERAAEFLGHRHCLSRTVEHGQRIGRTIGIPTVNLTMPEHVLAPAHGVYITRVYLPDGRSFAGVTNVGTRPTVSDSGAVSVETFLLDFDGDLYGQTIRLEFCRRLRGERKFDSLEVLRQEIQHNIAQTRDYFCGEA